MFPTVTVIVGSCSGCSVVVYCISSPPLAPHMGHTFGLQWARGLGAAKAAATYCSPASCEALWIPILVLVSLPCLPCLPRLVSGDMGSSFLCVLDHHIPSIPRSACSLVAGTCLFHILSLFPKKAVLLVLEVLWGTCNHAGPAASLLTPASPAFGDTLGIRAPASLQLYREGSLAEQVSPRLPA